MPDFTENEFKKATRTLIEDIYGVNLHPNHKGFLVALQFFAVIWGIENLDGQELFQNLSKTNKLTFTRRTHDFARRLLRNEIPSPQYEESWNKRKNQVSEDEATLRILSKIFESLTLPDKFSTKRTPQSNKSHLRPYLGELIHHDYAINRKNSTEGVRAERVYYRGGGTLVYELLRNDPNEDRREKVSTELRHIVSDSDDAVGRLAKILANSDASPPRIDDKQDEWEDDSLILHETKRESIWSENLRSGTLRILTAEIPRSRKVDYLMHWLPYCLANHMVALASSAMGTEPPVTPVDIKAKGALRRASQRRLHANNNLIRSAIIATAGKASNSPLLKLIHAEDFGDCRIENTLTSMAKFHSSTLAYVGALNHNKGTRHFTFNLPLLESIVYATVDHKNPPSISHFCTEILYKKMGLVVNDESGRLAGLSDEVDAADFEKNEEGLVVLLDSLGLITNYSDATRLVGPPL
jgi:hypothetical protein